MNHYEDEAPSQMDKLAIERVERNPKYKGWRPFCYEAAEGAIIITGCVPGIITRGPRKGQPNYRTGERIKTAVVANENPFAASVRLLKIIQELVRVTDERIVGDDYHAAWNSAHALLKELEP